VLDADKARDDETVILRMASYPDLFAFDAKYHRKCYAAFVTQRNIDAARRKQESHKPESIFEQCFKAIADELENNLLSDNKTVLTLANSTANFTDILTKAGVHQQVYSWKLSEKLKQHFDGNLAFIERRVLSDLVCSCTVTVGHALRKASELHEKQLEYDIGDLSDIVCEQRQLPENKVLLHAAAGILRDEIFKQRRQMNFTSLAHTLRRTSVQTVYQILCMISSPRLQMKSRTKLSPHVMIKTHRRMSCISSHSVIA